LVAVTFQPLSWEMISSKEASWPAGTICAAICCGLPDGEEDVEADGVAECEADVEADGLAECEADVEADGLAECEADVEADGLAECEADVEADGLAAWMVGVPDGAADGEATCCGLLDGAVVRDVGLIGARCWERFAATCAAAARSAAAFAAATLVSAALLVAAACCEACVWARALALALPLAMALALAMATLVVATGSPTTWLGPLPGTATATPAARPTAATEVAMAMPRLFLLR
jgi:hypothetical protein